MTPLQAWEARAARAERRRWTVGAVTIGLIAGTLAILQAAWHSRPAPSPAPSALPLIVELSPAPTSAAPPAAPPPAPAPPKPPPATPVAPPLPPTRRAPRVRPPVTPAPSPTPAELALPMQQAAAPTSAHEATPTVEPTRASTPAPPPGEDAAPAKQATAPLQAARSVERPPVDAAFQDQLLGHLQRYKRYPPTAQNRRQQGVPYVRFTMDRRGTVTTVALERSSGIAALDAEAIALPMRANPLPAPPATVPGDPIEIVVPIEFFLGR